MQIIGYKTRHIIAENARHVKMTLISIEQYLRYQMDKHNRHTEISDIFRKHKQERHDTPFNPYSKSKQSVITIPQNNEGKMWNKVTRCIDHKGKDQIQKT